jgi:hypothetical protein
MSYCANSEVMVSTQWVSEHKTDDDVVVVEVDVDTKSYIKAME